MTDSSLLPLRAFFRFSFSALHQKGLPRQGKRLLDLSKQHALPPLPQLEGLPAFGEIRIAWNSGGLGISVEVRNKRRPLLADSRSPTVSDGLQLWIDTRGTQNVHRASRFCRHLCLLPRGGAPRQEAPVALSLPIARAREEAPSIDPAAIILRSEVGPTGYLLESWLPASVLHGFDPEANSRLGFYYLLTDGEFGDQFPALGSEFPIAYDPSLWCTLELQPA